MSRLERDPQVEALVAAYRDGLQDAGMFAENEVTSPARSFLLRVGCEGWSSMSLEQQLAIPGQDRRLVTWLIVTGRLRPTPEYLVASKLRVGQLSARVHREFHGRFMATASERECRRNRVSVAERTSHAYENSQQDRSRRCCQRGAKRPWIRRAERGVSRVAGRSWTR